MNRQPHNHIYHHKLNIEWIVFFFFQCFSSLTYAIQLQLNTCRMVFLYSFVLVGLSFKCIVCLCLCGFRNTFYYDNDGVRKSATIDQFFFALMDFSFQIFFLSSIYCICFSSDDSKNSKMKCKCIIYFFISLHH